jgi:hypothetical protein
MEKKNSMKILDYDQGTNQKVNQILEAQREEYLLSLLTALEFHIRNKYGYAAIFADKALRLLDGLDVSLDNIINVKFHKILLKFLKSDYRSLVEEINPVSEGIKKILETKKDLTLSDTLDFNCILHILKSLNLFGRFMIEGTINIAFIEENIGKAKSIASQAGRVDLLYLIDKLSISINSLLTCK